MGAFRLALRRLRRAPSFSTAAILILGVGIAAATALFAVVDAVLLAPLPFREPDRLVWIWATHTDRDRAFFSIPDFVDVRAGNRTLEDLAPLATWAVNLVDAERAEGASAERVSGARIAPTGFALLGAHALHGRTLVAGDDAPERRNVVVLGNALWRRRFRADPTVVGRAIDLDGSRYTVVGVMPADFVLPNVDGDVFAPLWFDGDPRASQRGTNFLRAIARLPHGTSPRRASDDLAAIAARLARDYPATDAKMTAPRLLPLHGENAGAYRRGLLLLLGAVAAVLAIACANFAGLSLARLGARRGELALRAALGASRRRLAAMLFAESAILAGAAGVVGALLAPWGVELVRAAAPADLPRAAGIAVDARALAFAAAAAVACALLTGVAPALGAARATAGAVHGGGMGGIVSPSRGRGRARDGLIVLQLALSLVLMVSAGLLARTFARIAGADAGFDPRGV